MATTSIWPISGSISHVIQYIGNPDKTNQFKFNNPDLQSLKDVMDYAVQPTKTEQQRFVSGVNCLPEIARQQMIITKQRFEKLDGRTAYHAYQSFKPGETTPEIAHSIGVEFAEKLWGERFQVVVAVSAEPDCHSVAELVCHRLAGLDAGICWGRCPRFAENKASNSRRQKSDIYRRKLAFVLVRGVLLQ